MVLVSFQSVLRKVTPEDAPSISDQVMSALLRMFSTSGKAGGVQEDALLAVSTLVEGEWNRENHNALAESIQVKQNRKYMCMIGSMYCRHEEFHWQNLWLSAFLHCSDIFFSEIYLLQEKISGKILLFSIGIFCVSDILFLEANSFFFPLYW